MICPISNESSIFKLPKKDIKNVKKSSSIFCSVFANAMGVWMKERGERNKIKVDDTIK